MTTNTLPKRIRLQVWIDHHSRILSFHAIPDARFYSAADSEFWPQILSLIEQGYRIM